MKRFYPLTLCCAITLLLTPCLLLAAPDTSGNAPNLPTGPSKPLWLTQEARAKILAHGPWPPHTTPDPSNRLSGNPKAIAFGRRLFMSTRLSGDNTKSCLSCHAPEDAFASGRVIKENRVARGV